jgi:bis(5'-nucleosyl)-tetraphosphatase (symmetrical)
VLRRVRDLGSAAIVVLGNHDLNLLALAAGVRPHRPGDTLTPVLEAPDRDELLHWLRCRPLVHRRDGYILVHAGLFPGWSADDAAGEAARLERLLVGEALSDLVAKDGPSADDPEGAPEGLARDRTTLHGLTRMRSLRADGRLDRSFNGRLSGLPAGRVPWFRAEGRRTAENTVVFGHWSALGLLQEPGVVALDSGVAWGGPLSAVRLEDGRLVQADNLDVVARSF